MNWPTIHEQCTSSWWWCQSYLSFLVVRQNFMDNFRCNTDIPTCVVCNGLSQSRIKVVHIIQLNSQRHLTKHTTNTVGCFQRTAEMQLIAINCPCSFSSPSMQVNGIYPGNSETFQTLLPSSHLDPTHSFCAIIFLSCVTPLPIVTHIYS